MQYIYRIENKKGKGCYRGLVHSMEKAIEKYVDTKWFDVRREHPTPSCDKGIERWPFKREICGFVSVRQALKWFSSDQIRRLRRLGFDLKKVEVQTITAIGQHQCLAIR